MIRVAVLGAGAFGTALAIALARDGDEVTLWARDKATANHIQAGRENHQRLPGHTLPETIEVTSDLGAATAADCLLLALPMQALGPFLRQYRSLITGKSLVACCKGLDLAAGLLPHDVIRAESPDARPALLSGPGFAADIAAGLPTALTLAAEEDALARSLQDALSTAGLRLYRSTDMDGVACGGALKNVMAIACGVVIGAGLGESARAALLTRGYAEMLRYATERGAQPQTLAGLSGLGDLALTCTSTKSRNFSFGIRLGTEGTSAASATTEGIATARAVARQASRGGIDMPICALVAELLDGQTTVAEATGRLLARPLRPERE